MRSLWLGSVLLVGCVARELPGPEALAAAPPDRGRPLDAPSPRDAHRDLAAPLPDSRPSADLPRDLAAPLPDSRPPADLARDLAAKDSLPADLAGCSGKGGFPGQRLACGPAYPELVTSDGWVLGYRDSKGVAIRLANLEERRVPWLDNHSCLACAWTNGLVQCLCDDFQGQESLGVWSPDGGPWAVDPLPRRWHWGYQGGIANPSGSRVVYMANPRLDGQGRPVGDLVVALRNGSGARTLATALSLDEFGCWLGIGFVGDRVLAGDVCGLPVTSWDPATGAKVVLTPGGFDGAWRADPPAKRVAIGIADGGWLVAPTGGPPMAMKDIRKGFKVFSHDGQYLFNCDRTSPGRLTLANGSFVVLPPPQEGALCVDFALSPDSRFAWWEGYTCPIGNCRMSQLSRTDAQSPGRFRTTNSSFSTFTDDSRWFVVNEYSCRDAFCNDIERRSWANPTAGGNPIELPPETGHNYSCAAAGGSRLLLHQADGLYFIDLAKGGPLTRLVKDGWGLTTTPDKKGVVYGTTDGLYLLPLPP